MNNMFIGIDSGIDPQSVKRARDVAAAESLFQSAKTIESKIGSQAVAQNQLQALEEIANKLWQEAGQSTKEKERVADLLASAKVGDDGSIFVGRFSIGQKGEVRESTGRVQRNLSTGEVARQFKPADLSSFASEASNQNVINFVSPATETPPASLNLKYSFRVRVEKSNAGNKEVIVSQGYRCVVDSDWQFIDETNLGAAGGGGTIYMRRTYPVVEENGSVCSGLGAKWEEYSGKAMGYGTPPATNTLGFTIRIATVDADGVVTQEHLGNIAVFDVANCAGAPCP